MELRVEKTDLLCRTCLCFVVDEDYCNILEDVELSEKYANCTSLKVDPFDEYPKNICCSCCEQLTLFYDFKQMCCDTLGRFKDFLKSSTAEFLEKESELLQKEIIFHKNKFNSNKSIFKGEIYQVKDKSKQKSLNFNHETKHTNTHNNKIEVAEENCTHEFNDNKYVENNHAKVIDKIDLVLACEQIENCKVISGLDGLHDKSSSIKADQSLNNNIYLYNEAQNVDNSAISNGDRFTINESAFNTERIQQCVSSTQNDIKSSIEAEEARNVLIKSFDKEIERDCDISVEEPQADINKEIKFVLKKNKNIDHINLSSTTKQVELVKKLQRTHNSKRAFLCKLCPKKFHKEERFQAHLRIHKGLKAYACTQCDKQFVRIFTLHTHIQQHHSGSYVSHTCTYEGCTRTYNRKESLTKHISECHSHKTPAKNHMCEVCGKVFNRKMFLNRHRFMHVDKSSLPFECNECGRRFSKKLNLNYHLNRHAGIKNFICALCGLQKTTKSELKAHMNYHTLEKTWTCETCGKIFNTLGNLKLHMRTVHEGVRDYICRYCNRRFGKAGTLKCHEMRHTGERPHKCKLCGHGFIQAVALRTHMKGHAKMDEKIH